MHASIAEKNKLIIYVLLINMHIASKAFFLLHILDGAFYNYEQHACLPLHACFICVHLRDRIAMICILFDLQLWLLEKTETNKRLLTYPFSIKQYNLNCNA
ncbi:hypothetical protein T4D_14103 [Trichinella pseudospiralis]|uniref:Uncharacterized protein n=1 Tax=Trichinella pseudospiralis TaxID=6337 RepID=A0A0V1FIJ8_TRIPS|nr:hypothetical protein T4D_14103 [Trichinella pseudospiralis]